ncbi:two-component regulator propeller domain-containing protein [Parachryseolinea silvisoli]|uniref:two-component regulator propeller domain-containing protein n=1 Tax=Parachryseolinea silvisoli TaxID=2873601 RepID=UPI002265C118|nr:two-component regulator propeller domain-containing protein [Parachryseolinea silvisoli]MCD9020112.1 response regulator [Parachryseolinea silvisoli]
MLRRNHLFTLAACLSALYCSAQTLNFKHITVENGLSQNTVRSICQDSLGYLWFGTQNGLNRYNGHAMEIYEFDKTDSLSLSSNFISTLRAAKNGDVWIGTNHGLCVWNHRTGRFVRMDNKFDYDWQGGQYTFYAIYFDSEGAVWTLAHHAGMHIYRKGPSETRFKQIKFIDDEDNEKTWDLFGQIAEDADGNLWIGSTRNGLWTWHRKTHEWTKINDRNHDYAVTSLAVGKNNSIWLGTYSQGLVRFDVKRSQFRKIEGLNDHSIRKLYFDRNGKCWIGTDKGGLNLYDTVNSTFSYADHHPDDATTINHNSVMDIFRDKQGIVWLGTFAGGVNYVDPGVGKFKLITGNAHTSTKLSNNIVTSFAEDNKGNLWIGTDRGGLNYFDRKTGRFRHYRKDDRKYHWIPTDIIKHLLYTSRNQLWIGTWQGGLNYFDERKQEFIQYPIAAGSSGLSSDIIFFLKEDSNGNLWVGSPAGLDRIDARSIHNPSPRKIDVDHFKRTGNRRGELSDNYANTILEDSQKQIWVGTRNGINLFDPKSNSFFNAENNPTGKRIFTNDYIQCITQTKAGDYLIGTIENGLLHYMPQKDTLVMLNKGNGFPSNSIIGILEASPGNFWISTTNGLIKLNLPSGKFTHYNKEDGIQSNEFKENAYYKLSTGEMLFGGTNGFNLFHPDSITENPYSPAPIITVFKLFNKPISPGENTPLKQHISITNEIVLNHNQSFIGFEFTSLNFSIPEKNQYAYMLKGVDKQWNYVKGDRSANYSYLPPGRYEFRVKAANNDGVWSPTPARLILLVNPSWWNTIWFRLAVIAMLLTLIWALFKWRTHTLYQRKKILEHTVTQRTTELQESNAQLSLRQKEVIHQREEIKIQRDNLEQQYNTIQSLSEIGQTITASIKQDELIKQMYTTINKLMDASLFSIGYFSHEKNVIEFSTLKGHGATIDANHISIDESRLSAWCLRNNETLLLDDIQQYVRDVAPEMQDRYADDTPYRSAIYLPIDSKKRKPTEILVVKSHQPRCYTQIHLNTLKNLTAYIAIAFDNARVYKKIEHQSEMLTEQSQRLTELDRMKTRFFLNISHEFRTPLTLIVSPLAKMLGEKKVQELPNVYRQLEMMNNNANQLLRLINELLEIRNIESGGSTTVVADQLDLVKFTSDIILRFEETAREYDIRFNLLSDAARVMLWLDKNMMEKILLNLYSNACKYTRAGGRIDTFINYEDTPEGRCVKIAIKDTGIGIPENELPYIFERFYQGAEPINYNQEGTGIGLSFVKDLVSFHSGKISVESKINSGTAFTILFPLGHAHFKESQLIRITPEEGDTPAAPSPVEEESTGKKRDELPILLIVEDHRDVKDFLKMELENEYVIVEAKNGADGVDVAFQNIPDLIISDIMMPVMDGIKLCTILKSDERTSHIPIILLTAKTGEDSHIRGLDIGADDYIPKPFNIRILRARIQNLIASRKMLHAIFSSREKIEVTQLFENKHDRIFIEKTNNAIRENVKNPNLNHEVLAKEVGMSKTQLYRKLHAITGNTVHEYIRNYRLRCAEEMLGSNPDLMIFEIAYELGFKDHAYFSKCFHALYGQSPVERKKEKEKLRLEPGTKKGL